jgi:hypothetical protein
VRHALLDADGSFSRNRPDRLTWSDHSHPIQVISIASESELTTEDVVEIRCQMPRQWYGESGSSIAMMGMGSKEKWAQQAFFGIHPEINSRDGLDMEEMFSAPESKTLPEVLAAINAEGWLAEGLTRLYLVEEVRRRYAARFENLEVSPATAQGVRVKGSFSLGSGNRESVSIEGLVPLRRSF